MLHHSARHFAFTAIGSVLRAVECEHCGDAFSYRLVRVVTKERTSHYFLNNQGAADRAERAAKAALDTALRSGADPVPCPYCQRLQTDMFRATALDRHKRMIKIWIWPPFLLLGGIAFTGVWLALKDWLTSQWTALLGGSAALTLFAGFVTIRLQARRIWAEMRAAIHSRRRQDPIPGMPPALVPEPDCAGGGATRLVSNSTSACIDHQGWLTVQFPRIPWPPHCCRCMAVAETKFRPWFRLTTTNYALPVPLCERCAGSLRTRALLWLLAALPLGIGGTGLFSLAIPGDYEGRLIVTFIGGGVIAIVLMFMLPVIGVRPYRAKVIDEDRGIWRIRFADVRFARVVAEAQEPDDAARAAVLAAAAALEF